jgi:hypothetical protein
VAMLCGGRWTLVAVTGAILVLGGCGGAARTTTMSESESRHTNPVAKAQEILAKEYMSNHITEAQYHAGLQAVQREGEAAVCRKDAELFPQNCNPDGSVK